MINKRCYKILKKEKKKRRGRGHEKYKAHTLFKRKYYFALKMVSVHQKPIHSNSYAIMFCIAVLGTYLAPVQRFVPSKAK